MQMTEPTLQERYDALVARNLETCREVAILTDHVMELEKVFWAAVSYRNAMENKVMGIDLFPGEHQREMYQKLMCAMGPVQQRLCSAKEEKDKA